MPSNRQHRSSPREPQCGSQGILFKTFYNALCNLGLKSTLNLQLISVDPGLNSVGQILIYLFCQLGLNSFYFLAEGSSVLIVYTFYFLIETRYNSSLEDCCCFLFEFLRQFLTINQCCNISRQVNFDESLPSAFCASTDSAFWGDASEGLVLGADAWL